MMRRPIFIGLAALIGASAAGPLSAQHEHHTAPDSLRPQDTRPSIPIATPAVEIVDGESTTAADQAPTTTSPATDARSTPLSSIQEPQATAPPAGGPGIAASDTGAVPLGGVGTVQGRAEPYAGGLPQRAAPPRTLRAYWHVFIAFAIVWALLFGYALSVGRRFGRLEDEVRRLGGPTG